RGNIRQGFDRLRCFFLMIAAICATKRPDNKPASQLVAYKNGQGTPGRLDQLIEGREAVTSGHHFAAVGSGFGLSDSEWREAITSARWLAFWMPAKPIAVPGMKPFGLVMNWLRSSIVQVPPLALMAAEKLKPPRPSPLWSPTMP